MLWSAGEPRCTRQPSDRPRGGPIQLAIRILVLAGTPLLAIGLLFLYLHSAFDCWGGCPESEDPTLARSRVEDVSLAIISAAPVVVAWILCLVQLVRIGRRAVAVALALALPLVAVLSLWLFYASSGGTWRPTTLATIAFERLLGLLLLWPVATFVATFALRRR